MAGIDSYSKMVLHMNGADGSTVFTDATGNHTVTAHGNAQIDTAQKKFGTGSGLFFRDTDSDYLTIPASSDFQFGTGRFTIDFWYRCPNLSGVNDEFFSLWTNSGHFIDFNILTIAGGYRFEFRSENTTTSQFVVLNTGANPSSLSNDTWYHIALIRGWGNIDDRWAICLNGNLADNYVTDSDSFADLLVPLEIGYWQVSGGSCYLNGWLDEFRVSKGIARWTTNFTPPTKQYSIPQQRTQGIIIV